MKRNGKMMPTLTAVQEDACARITLLYMGPGGSLHGPEDEYVRRLYFAMTCGDVEEAEYVSAVMLCIMVLSLPEDSLRVCSDSWNRAFGLKASVEENRECPN